VSRRMIAGTLTIALMGLILWIGGRRRSGRPVAESGAVTTVDPSESPEALIRALLEHARQGDIAAYLDAFNSPIRSRIAREVEEQGRDAFAVDLRRAAGARKGHAVFAPVPDGPDACWIVVESVYPDRNERQTYRLERTADGWRVVEVETVRGRSPAARFGAAATYQEPEGIPVEGNAPTESAGDPEP
jgi:hypothetical protein